MNSYQVDTYLSYKVELDKDGKGNLTWKTDGMDGSAWNFHAWTEAWLGRSDLPKYADQEGMTWGWEAIDGTNSFGPARQKTVREFSTPGHPRDPLWVGGEHFEVQLFVDAVNASLRTFIKEWSQNESNYKLSLTEWDKVCKYVYTHGWREHGADLSHNARHAKAENIASSYCDKELCELLDQKSYHKQAVDMGFDLALRIKNKPALMGQDVPVELEIWLVASPQEELKERKLNVSVHARVTDYTDTDWLDKESEVHDGWFTLTPQRPRIVKEFVIQSQQLRTLYTASSFYLHVLGMAVWHDDVDNTDDILVREDVTTLNNIGASFEAIESLRLPDQNAVRKLTNDNDGAQQGLLVRGVLTFRNPMDEPINNVHLHLDFGRGYGLTSEEGDKATATTETHQQLTLHSVFTMHAPERRHTHALNTHALHCTEENTVVLVEQMAYLDSDGTRGSDWDAQLDRVGAGECVRLPFMFHAAKAGDYVLTSSVQSETIAHMYGSRVFHIVSEKNNTLGLALVAHGGFEETYLMVALAMCASLLLLLLYYGDQRNARKREYSRID
jgi:hypothetical protein